MREIIFRGKSVDNGEWVEGYYVCDTTGKNTHHYIFPENTCEGVVVIPETVGQYTELKDKSGKKIFEDDIVKVKYYNDGERIKQITVVTYDHETGGYSPFNWDYACDGCGFNLFIIEVEIIGNMHDNPELLEGVNK